MYANVSKARFCLVIYKMREFDLMTFKEFCGSCEMFLIHLANIYLNQQLLRIGQALRLVLMIRMPAFIKQLQSRVYC